MYCFYDAFEILFSNVKEKKGLKASKGDLFQN